MTTNDENPVLENLKIAKSVAVKIFKASSPSSSMVFGVHDRVFGDEDADESDHKAIIGDLGEAYMIAVELFGERSPSTDEVFGVYDRMFTDMLDGGE